MTVAWNPEMDEALRAGLAHGRGLAVIAEDIGVAHATAATRADALGIERPRRTQRQPKAGSPPRVTMEMQFAELLAEGFSAQDAADRIGAANGNAMLQRIRAKLGPQAV